MVSDHEIGTIDPCYTFDTLMRLQGTGLVPSQIFFITGADAFAEIETWSRYPQVLELAQFVVVSRPGHAAAALPSRLPALAARMRNAAMPVSTAVGAPSGSPAILPALEVLLLDAPTRDVSSTEVRRRLESGASIAGLVPAAVETYIAQHGLYSRGGAGATFGKSLA